MRSRVFYGTLICAAVLWLVWRFGFHGQPLGVILSPPPNPMARVSVLDQQVDLEIVDQPFYATLEHLADTYQFELEIDQRTLNDMGGVRGDELVTLQANGIALRAALRHLARQVDFEMSTIEHHGRATVTYPNKWRSLADNYVGVNHTFNAASGSASRWPQSDLRSAIYTVTGGVWEENGGLGVLEFSPGGVSVSQTPDVQRQIAKLIEVIALDPADSAPVAIDYPAHRNNRVVFQKLSTIVETEFYESTIGDAIGHLTKQAGVPVVFDPAQIESSGDVSATFHRLPAYDAIHLICERYGLYAYPHNGVLLIESSNTYQDDVYWVAYPLAGVASDRHWATALTAPLQEFVDDWSLGKTTHVLSDDWLLVAQSSRGHRQVERLLDGFRMAHGTRGFATGPHGQRQRRIERALELPPEVDLSSKTVEQAALEIERHYGFDVWLRADVDGRRVVRGELSDSLTKWLAGDDEVAALAGANSLLIGSSYELSESPKIARFRRVRPHECLVGNLPQLVDSINSRKRQSLYLVDDVLVAQSKESAERAERFIAGYRDAGDGVESQVVERFPSDEGENLDDLLAGVRVSWDLLDVEQINGFAQEFNDRYLDEAELRFKSEPDSLEPFHIADTDLRSALELLADETGVGVSFSDGDRTISMYGPLVTRVYPLGDFNDLAALGAFVVSTMQPFMAQRRQGEGLSYSIVGDRLIVVADSNQHAQIDQLMSALRAARSASEAGVFEVPRLLPRERAIQTALAKKVDLRVVSEQPLELVRRLAAERDIPLRLSTDLESADFEEITGVLHDVSLSTVIDWAVESAGLSYVVEHEHMVIGLPESFSNQELRIYGVGSLLACSGRRPREERQRSAGDTHRESALLNGLGLHRGVISLDRGVRYRPRVVHFGWFADDTYRWDPLAQLASIVATPGEAPKFISTRAHRIGDLLVVAAPRRAHRRIEELLGRLRDDLLVENDSAKLIRLAPPTPTVVSATAATIPELLIAWADEHRFSFVIDNPREFEFDPFAIPVAGSEFAGQKPLPEAVSWLLPPDERYFIEDQPLRMEAYYDGGLWRVAAKIDHAERSTDDDLFEVSCFVLSEQLRGAVVGDLYIQDLIAMTEPAFNNGQQGAIHRWGDVLAVVQTAAVLEQCDELLRYLSSTRSVEQWREVLTTSPQHAERAVAALHLATKSARSDRHLKLLLDRLGKTDSAGEQYCLLFAIRHYEAAAGSAIALVEGLLDTDSPQVQAMAWSFLFAQRGRAAAVFERRINELANQDLSRWVSDLFESPDEARRLLPVLMRLMGRANSNGYVSNLIVHIDPNGDRCMAQIRRWKMSENPSDVELSEELQTPLQALFPTRFQSNQQ
ncbi:MAG: hypothetical protein QGG36_28615 [Pirellulaceae bacterium]|jgi:hypothetical protein|nr:hypothetical protein [Pirellulaceae bacterium]